MIVVIILLIVIVILGLFLRDVKKEKDIAVRNVIRLSNELLNPPQYFDNVGTKAYREGLEKQNEELVHENHELKNKLKTLNK